MGLIPGPSPDLLTLHKRKLSWLRYDQIGCVSTTGRYIDTLDPILVPGGRKAVVIRTSDHRTGDRGASTHRPGLRRLAHRRPGVLREHGRRFRHNGPVLIRDARPSSGGCDGHELNDAPFTVGSRFHDTASNTTIDVISQSGDDYRITIAFGVAP
jgi:hypothetical protein